MSIVSINNIKLEDLPKAFIVEQETVFHVDYLTGYMMLQKNEVLFQIEDDKMNYSNGICSIDVRHLLARPDLFTPCDYNKLQQIEK